MLLFYVQYAINGVKWRFMGHWQQEEPANAIHLQEA
jgi:hypothetical protein